MDRNILTDQTKTNDFKPFGKAMTKITNRTVDKAFEIYLCLYQAVTGTEEEQNIYKPFPPDFFDLIIVDSPPMGAVTDAVLIAERTDEVIYVCRFNRAYRKHIRLYIKSLREGKNEFLGIVLNGLSARRIEYYSNYRYYRSYKKYYGAQS